jgi:hypothetical protein
MQDLTSASFRVHLNGKPVQVLDARYSVAPRRIVILFDVSRSMWLHNEKTEKWEIAKEAMGDLLAEAPRDVPIAMLTFSNEVHEEFQLSQSRTDIAKWMASDPGHQPGLSYPAKTALFDAILAGLRVLGEPQPGDALYVITDGRENASHASLAQTKAALLQSKVRLFAFLLAGPEREFSPEEDAKDNFVDMVKASGGMWFGTAALHWSFAPSWQADFAYGDKTREKIKTITQELNTIVSGVWILELAMPPLRPETKLYVEVVGPRGNKMRDVRLMYPRLLP